MTNTRQVRTKFRERFVPYQKLPFKFKATVGDANGDIQVPGEPGFIYVTDFVDTRHKALNYVAPINKLGVLVWVGYDPYDSSRLIVLRLVNPYAQSAFQPIPGHHETHEWLGSDMVDVDGPQIKPALVRAKTGTDMVVSIFPFMMRMLDGKYRHIPYQEVDLTTHIPGAGALWVVVAFDAVTGLLSLQDGSVISSLTLLSRTSVPAATAGTTAIAAVACYAGQTAVVQSATQNCIADLRWSGGGGAAASIVGPDFYNVMDYGAVGDGVEDDTIAIQAALDAAHAAGGGVVWLPARTYLVTNLTCYRDVGIFGAGDEVSVLKSNSAGTLLNFPYGGTLLASRFHATYRDFSLNGDSIGTTGISIDVGHNMLLERIGVENFTGIGFELKSVLIATLLRCRSESNGTGVQGDASHGIESNLVDIADCRIVENTSWGVHWVGGDLISISNTTEIETNGTPGDPTTGGLYYKGHTVQGIHIQDVWFEANEGLADIELDTPDVATWSLIEACNFVESGSATYGIYVKTASSKVNHVEGRMCRFNGSAGTAHWYASGTGAVIELTNSGGTTGSTGGGVVSSAGAATTVATEVAFGQSSVVGTLLSYAREDHSHGTPALSTSTPTDVASAGAVGSGSSATKSDHAHKGVRSLAKTGGTQLFGDVELTEGLNITLTQSGNAITIASASGGGSGITGIIMEEGVTFPPVPLTSEEGDDWLYAEP